MLPLETREKVTQPTEQINEARRQHCNTAYQVFQRIGEADTAPIPPSDLEQYSRARKLTLRTCRLYLPERATELIDVLIISKVIAELEGELTLIAEVMNETS